MFRKIVSQLSFSPALVGQLSFYAKRLRKEQATRRLGLIFVAMALVVQSLVVFQAPEAANASSSNDFVPGGLGIGANRSLNNFLAPYDRNDRNLKDIFNYFGITREEITNTTFGYYTIGGKKSYGFENRASSTTIEITDSNFTPVTTIYGRDQTIFGDPPSTKVYGYIGHSSKIGWFAIMQYCGNLITERFPDKPTPPAPANVVPSKSAINVTQGSIDATKTSAKANDVITYSVTAKNTGGTATTLDMKDSLADVLTFSSLTNNGGGTFNATQKTLTWANVALAPGQTVTKSYTVRMNASLVTTKKDCEMNNLFMDKIITIPVGCTTPPAKIVVDKTSFNVSQGNVDATTVTAKESDKIVFTLTAENTGGTAKSFTFEDSLSDVLEYAKLADNGGGTFNEDTKKLSWPAITLEPGDKQTRTFAVQILSTIPATPQGISDPSSYDCKIENTFYDAYVVIPVTCATPKIIENVVTELPTTGPTENMIFAGIVLALVTFFYYRSKQLGTEIRLIRRDINGGTL